MHVSRKRSARVWLLLLLIVITLSGLCLGDVVVIVVLLLLRLLHCRLRGLLKRLILLTGVSRLVEIICGLLRPVVVLLLLLGLGLL